MCLLFGDVGVVDSHNFKANPDNKGVCHVALAQVRCGLGFGMLVAAAQHASHMYLQKVGVLLTTRECRVAPAQLRRWNRSIGCLKENNHTELANTAHVRLVSAAYYSSHAFLPLLFTTTSPLLPYIRRATAS
jgi:hypothetical protein